MLFNSLARLLLCSALATAVGCTPDNSGHERMVQSLEKIKVRSASEHPSFERASVQQAKDELARLPADGAQVRRLTLHWQLAEDLLRLDPGEEAIEHFLAARELFDIVRDRLAADLQEELDDELLLDLAVAYLRLGETQNCVHCRTGESCILPIQGSGVHEQPTGSRKAIELFNEMLTRQPDDVRVRWLLNLAYMTLGEYPDGVPDESLIPTSAFESKETIPRFYDIANDAGVSTFSCAGGAVVDDFDGDGALDLMTSNFDPAGQLQLFRNRGDGTFENRTEQGGLTGLLGGLNLIHADYDNDNDLDVFVLRGAWLGEDGRQPNSLLENDGNGNFRDVTFAAGLGDVHYPTKSADWADYDRDGDLDLFIANEDYPCQLFRNNGNGTFVDVAPQAGVDKRSFPHGAVWGDFNSDSWPDLYVSNDSSENCLYRNEGNGTFTDVASQLGVTRPLMSFGVWFWDVNNDGNLDIYAPSHVAGVQYVAADFLNLPGDDERDCLYLGDGKGGFREVAAEYGLDGVTQPMGMNYGDFDYDGYADFYLGTGYFKYEGLMPNLMFHNCEGKRFSDVTYSGGFGHLQKGHGVAFADVDDDGDQDVFIQTGGGTPGDAFGDVLFDNPGFGNHWLKVRLVGRTSDRYGVGARIRVDIEERGTSRSIYKWVGTGGSFGANPYRQEIGLGAATRISLLQVDWPTTGETQEFRDVPVDCSIEIHEGDSEYRSVPRQ